MYNIANDLRRLAAVLLLAAMAGCASAAEGRQSGYERNRIVVTESEVQRYRNALELVSNLRPQWLERRGSDGPLSDDPILVYRNTQRLGGVDLLRGLEVGGLRELRFLNAAEATQLYGTGHRSGVIVVVSR